MKAKNQYFFDFMLDENEAALYYVVMAKWRKYFGLNLQNFEQICSFIEHQYVESSIICGSSR